MTNKIVICNSIYAERMCPKTKIIKEIEDIALINQYLELIIDSEIVKGTIADTGSEYTMFMYGKENDEIAKLEFNPGLVLTLKQLDYFLLSDNIEKIIDLING